MSFYSWRPYVPLAEKRRNAEKRLAKLVKKGRPISPVTIDGRIIAKTFWGKSWCSNLERYSDYSNRLPRGRTYVRNGSVLDLQIAKGEISAFVSGSELYTVKITVEPVTAPRWKAVCKDCSGAIDSLVELLQGRLSKAVMDRVCRKGDGLFPSPKEINLSCSCPDWADMCKHVAAVLYGVGARLDEKPEHLFALRAVNIDDLLARAGAGHSLAKPAPAATKLLEDAEVSALFGLEMAETTSSDRPAPPKQRTGAPRGQKPRPDSKVAGRVDLKSAGKRATTPQCPNRANQDKRKKTRTA